MRVVHTNRGAIKIQDIEAEEILKNRNSFTVFKDRLSIVKHMNSEEKAQFLDYILGYQLNGNESMPEDASPITRAAIEQITTGFKLSEDRYIARVMANRKNGAKGGRKPNKNQSNPIEPNRTKEALIQIQKQILIQILKQILILIQIQI